MEKVDNKSGEKLTLEIDNFAMMSRGIFYLFLFFKYKSSKIH